jgi:hypothetical protein
MSLLSTLEPGPTYEYLPIELSRNLVNLFIFAF